MESRSTKRVRPWTIPLREIAAIRCISVDENRYLLIGESPEGRLLIVSYAIRGDVAWLISARKTTRRERRIYMNAPDSLSDKSLDDDMLPDYGDYDGWGPARHRFTRLKGTVTLDTDVFDVFRTSEEVNVALRTLIREGRMPRASSPRHD
jgi:hypothetical protein